MTAGELAKRLLDYLPARCGLTLLITLRWLVKRTVRSRDRRTRRIMRQIGSPRYVMSGPFAGMRYLGPAMASQGGYLPKLLGTYEAECRVAVERLIALQPDVLVNVGAAEGYYAVGFLTRLPDLRVVAFEAERPYHAAIRLLAVRNQVHGRLTVCGSCTASALDAALSSAKRPVVVMDCEGAERDLMRIRLAPRLAGAVILVEVHDQRSPGTAAAITTEFASTHHVERIRMRAPALPADSPAGKLAEEDRRFALDEGRGGDAEWLLLERE